MPSHIVYRVINGIEYAWIATSAGVEGKVIGQAKALGRVLDKEMGIDRSGERGGSWNQVTG